MKARLRNMVKAMFLTLLLTGIFAVTAMAYDVNLRLSSSHVFLDLDELNTETIMIDFNGSKPEHFVSYCDIDDKSIADCYFGGWWDSDGLNGDDKNALTIRGKKAGETWAYVRIYDSSNNNMLASKYFDISVIGKNTISFDPNGGSGGPNPMTKKTNATIYIPYAEPTRSGYRFRGWGLNAYADKAWYEAGDPCYAEKDTTLYAIWEPLKGEYTITYHANGGIGAPEPGKKKEGKDTYLSSVWPTRTGYTFKGWSTSSTSTIPEYGKGGAVKYKRDADIDLYAVWEMNTYTLRFSGNGGTGEPPAVTKKYGEDVSLSNIKPAWSDYIFKGWSTDSHATYPQYEPGDHLTLYDNMTLYAVWGSPGYTTYYDACGGYPTPEVQTTPKNSYQWITSTIPYKEGYEFLGWSTYEGAYSARYKYGDLYFVMDDMTLYAVWKN